MWKDIAGAERLQLFKPTVLCQTSLVGVVASVCPAPDLWPRHLQGRCPLLFLFLWKYSVDAKRVCPLDLGSLTLLSLWACEGL